MGHDLARLLAKEWQWFEWRLTCRWGNSMKALDQHRASFETAASRPPQDEDLS